MIGAQSTKSSKPNLNLISFTSFSPPLEILERERNFSGLCAQIVIIRILFFRRYPPTEYIDIFWCALFVALQVVWTPAHPNNSHDLQVWHSSVLSLHILSPRPLPDWYFIEQRCVPDVFQRLKQTIVLLCDPCLVPHTKPVTRINVYCIFFSSLKLFLDSKWFNIIIMEVAICAILL